MTDAADARAVAGRKAAWLHLVKTYPKLFPATLVTPGLRQFAVGPSAGFRKGYDGYWAYTPANIEAMWTEVDSSLFSQFLKLFMQLEPTDGLFFSLLWGQEKSDMDVYLMDAATFGQPLGFTDGSANNMQLYALTLKDPTLIAMADERTGAVIKAQPLIAAEPKYPGEANASMLEFTNEVVVSRLLNTLVTAWPHTATPHFTAFLGCFKRRGVPDAIRPMFQSSRVFAVYERANTSFTSIVSGDKPPSAYFNALIFQALFTLEVAAYTLGYAHNDLHTGNIMVRDVTGTRYADRVWAYKLRGRPGFWFIHPAAHQNKMVEIIDQGRATIEAVPPEHIDSAYKENFANDVRRLFANLLLNLPQLAACKRIVDLLPDHDGPRAPNAHSRLFYERWFTDDPTYGLQGVLTRSGISPNGPAQGEEPPIVVAIAPEDTLATRPDEPMAVELGNIWGLAQGMKRTRRMDEQYLACVTCRAPAYHALHKEGKEVGFCGRDCARVYRGRYHV